MKSVETQLGKEKEIRKKITNHLIIRQLVNIHTLDCPLQGCRKDDYLKKKKGAGFSIFFVRVGCGSWKGKCPGTKASPHVCARPWECTQRSLCPPCSALTGPSRALSPSLSLLQASETWNPHSGGVIPSSARTPADQCPCMNLPCCFSALCLDCLHHTSSWSFKTP